MSKVTVSQAAFLTGKSRETINKATLSGKVTHSENEEGAKVIDVSELERAYKLVRTMDDLKLSEVVKESQDVTQTPPSDLKEVAVLRARLDAAINERDLIKAERERERQQAREQIENLQNSLAMAQEQGSKTLLLLTNQTGEKQGDQSQQMKELAKSVELVRRQNNHLNKKLEAQANRTFWQWLTGGGSKTQSSANKPGLSQAS